MESSATEPIKSSQCSQIIGAAGGFLRIRPPCDLFLRASGQASEGLLDTINGTLTVLLGNLEQLRGVFLTAPDLYIVSQWKCRARNKELHSTNAVAYSWLEQATEIRGFRNFIQ
jgi:hypothetical protein